MRRRALTTIGLLSLASACSPSSDAAPGSDASIHEGGDGRGRGPGGPDGSGDADASRRSEGGKDTGPPTDGGADAAGPTPPPQAAAAGYSTRTFSSSFARSTIDLANSKTSGFQWYLAQFFGSPATPASDLTFDADGTLALDGAGTSSNAGINTAAPSSNAAGWVGVAFGGGAYFEATFHFQPEDTIKTGGKGWPSFWAMAIEHLAELPAQQWPGQASGYAHFIETDFFEYDVWSFAAHTDYGGAMHDWYGVYDSTCSAGFCSVSNSGGGSSFNDFVVVTPTTTDYTKDHAYGFLWVPATSTTSGKATYYFDGVATSDIVTWSQYAGSDVPPPGTAPWTFGVLDPQHVALIFGTGAGEPMTLKSVSVWQKSAAENLVE